MSIFQIIDDNTKKLPFFINSIGFDAYQFPVLRPKGFIYNHMITVLEGEGIVECDGQKCNVNEGDIFFIKKDIPHSYYSKSNIFKTQWITFDGTSCESFFVSQNISNFKLFRDIDLIKLNKVFETLYMKTSQSLNDFDLSIYIYAYIVTFFNCEKNTNISVNIEKSIEYIKNNYNKCITLEELAKISKMNKYAFCREFKKKYNTTAFNFLLKTRIQHAKTILVDSNDKIQNIAAKTGFNDTGYFCRIFKEEENFTPTEFRNILKKDG